jgi:hypothetical protein
MDSQNKWLEEKAIMLDGLSGSLRGITETVMENQRSHLLRETAVAGSTSASDIAGFRKIMIPMIRRIIPGTIASELVGVQPMDGPVGLVYSLRFKYGENMAAGATAGPNDITAGDELFGNSHPIRRFYSGSTGAAQAAGASGFGAPAVGNITGNATGNAWGSTLDAAAGCTVGGAGSFLEGSGGRKATFEILSQAVEAGSRKLQTSWTMEAMQDAKNQHGMDIESEMTKTMSAQVVQEIDNEIITDLTALAGTVAVWDGSVPAAPGYYRPTFIGDRLANLGVMISYVANEIARKTRRGQGNFIVVSPMMVTVLQNAAKSQFAPAIRGSFKGPNNTQLVGTLNGTIKVYSYLWNQVQSTDVAGGTGVDTILVGYKGGEGETDAGYFYCPYIPLQSTGVITNPTTFQPVVSLSTRYGKTYFTNPATSLGNSADYYGKINVSNLSFA